MLPQPLTSNQLYNVFGNASRVSQSTSLFDYGPGQTTATFTDTTFPTDPLTLANLPANVVAQAAQMAAAAGITDPGIAQAAELDYLATGDPSFITSAANVQQQVVSTAPATVTTNVPPAPAVGVATAQPAVVEAASGPTPVTFDLYLTAPETSDTPVSYTVVAPGAGFLGASAFGGALPSGTVTIPAGSTSVQFTVNLPQGALGAVPNENLEVQISTPNGQPIFAPTAQTRVVNNQPEAGAPALPQLAYLGNVGAFTQNGNSYTLDLSAVKDQYVPPLQFAVLNAATAPADDLGGSFAPPTGNGFAVIGNTLSSPLLPGQSYDGLTVTASTTTSAGAHSETLVFHPKDVNDSGYSASLPDVTLTINNSVAASAQAQINTPTTIIFPNAHVGATDSQAVSITNTATPPAASLDVIAAGSGDATANGSISPLAPGATDHTSLSVGLDTSAAGARSGGVGLSFLSDAGNGNTSPLPPSNIDIFGNIYREAVFTVTPNDLTVRVGAPGTHSLTITNTDPNDGFSENLIASVVGTTGAVTASGATGDIAPQATGAIPVTFSTATAGSIGAVTLAQIRRRRHRRVGHDRSRPGHGACHGDRRQQPRPGHDRGVVGRRRLHAARQRLYARSRDDIDRGECQSRRTEQRGRAGGRSRRQFHDRRR